jgi:hypothetical protein
MTGIALDGSPDAFYRRIPATGEPELIHGQVRAGASILAEGGLRLASWLPRPGWFEAVG